MPSDSCQVEGVDPSSSRSLHRDQADLLEHLRMLRDRASTDRHIAGDVLLATRQVISDHIIDLDGDTARLRANLTAMHLWSDEESGPRNCKLIRRRRGISGPGATHGRRWRLSELSLHNTWRTGAGLSATARSGSPRDYRRAGFEADGSALDSSVPTPRGGGLAGLVFGWGVTHLLGRHAVRRFA